MKVIHVIDKLDVGGAEQVFLTITSLLFNSGLSIGVLLFNKDGALTHRIDKHIELYCLDRGNKYSPRTLYKAHTICRQFDIVHVHMRHCFTYVSLARFLFSGKYKVVLHDHYGNIEIDKTVPFKMHLFKPAFYIGVSSQLQTWAQNVLGINKRDTFLLRNTVLSNDSVIPRRSNNTVPNIILISNFRKTKNIEFAVQLITKLQWNLTIYGQPVDIEYYQAIATITSGQKNIKIVNNITSLEDIVGNYDLAIHCAFSESGPLVLMEYMRSGLPFISYKTGEVADVIHEELPMLFMDSFDESKWIDRMHELIRMDSIGQHLKNVLQKHFSTNKYVEDCDRIYQHIHS